MTFSVEIGYASRTGKRSHNEDFAGALLPEPSEIRRGCIAAVADGVSTGGRGREAAMTSVTTVVRDYFCVPDNWDTTVALDRLIATHNSWLASQNRRREQEENGSGLTTLTALVLRGHTWTLAHVGDTRAYLLRDGVLTQLTTDHVRDSIQMKQVLMRALGLDDRVLVDYSQGELQIGDVFLLMTDGVHGSLKNKHIPLLIDKQPNQPAQAASEALVDAALDAGSSDNCTALVLRVNGLNTEDLLDAQRRAKQLPIPKALRVGDVLDGFVVTEAVANNGINVVYQVEKEKQRYALKTLHELRANDAEERAMLAHEAWLSERLTQTEINTPVSVLEKNKNRFVHLHHVPDASAFYLLYEWLDGETLERLLDQRREQKTVITMPVPEVLEILVQVIRGLGLLHRQGIIHRDIKPANLHRSVDGCWRILDMGVALTGKEPEAMRLLHAGTPSYINPEQWGYRQPNDEPQAADTQSDLFALGVVLYQMLTGRLPYGDVLPYQVGRYTSAKAVTPPSRIRPDVPIWLDHVALKAVSLDKNQRFETAEEFLLAVERGAARPLTAPPPVPLLQRDATVIWKIGFGVSLFINVLLIYWVLFLPR